MIAIEKVLRRNGKVTLTVKLQGLPEYTEPDLNLRLFTLTVDGSTIRDPSVGLTQLVSVGADPITVKLVLDLKDYVGKDVEFQLGVVKERVDWLELVSSKLSV